MKSIINFFKKSFFDFRIWLLFFLLQFLSLRPLYKYLSADTQFLIPVYLITLFIIYRAILLPGRFRNLLKPMLSNFGLTLILLFVIFAINLFLYPVADSLKLVMRGSDQDDALIRMGSRLIAGLNPYEAKTYFRQNPLSPGPGWVILTLPFSVTGNYSLLTPTFIAVLVLMLRVMSKDFYRSNLFLILCMSSLVFWETMVIGSDLIAIGALFLFFVFLLYYKMSLSPIFTAIIMILIAFTATSRVVFIYIIFLLGILLFKRNRLKHLNLLIYAFLIVASLHIFFYLWNPAAYSPFHILKKADKFTSFGLKISGLLVTIFTLYFTTLKVKDSFKSWVLFFWFNLLIPLFFVSYGELSFFRKFNFAEWEGANYLVLLFPLFLTYIVLDLTDTPELHLKDAS